jgi:hypothetical protein
MSRYPPGNDPQSRIFVMAITDAWLGGRIKLHAGLEEDFQ